MSKIRDINKMHLGAFHNKDLPLCKFLTEVKDRCLARAVNEGKEPNEITDEMVLLALEETPDNGTSSSEARTLLTIQSLL